jgi:hypothetical protein
MASWLQCLNHLLPQQHTMLLVTGYNAFKDDEKRKTIEKDRRSSDFGK